MEPPPMDSRALSELLERVRKAKGPDRELDKALWRHLIFDAELDKPGHDWMAQVGKTTPAYTASIDSALALVERLLPQGFLERLSDRRKLITCGDWHVRL